MAPKKTEAPKNDAFADRLDEDRPDAWKPNPGDKLIGTLERYTVGRSKHPKLPDSYPIAIVRDESTGDLVSVHIVLTAISSQFKSANPVAGERIGIVYNGKRTAESGSEYHDYRVMVDRPELDASEASSFAAVAGLSEGVESAPESDEEDELPF